MNSNQPDSHRCLACYKSLSGQEEDFHPACSRRFFGTAEPPVLPFSLRELDDLAREVIQRSTSVTGVQAKLSLSLQLPERRRGRGRFTIVGLWGEFVLKPPTEEFPALPENEDLTMHLAGLLKIRTVPHSLIRMASGELAYISRRVDRVKGVKLAMEDLCQLSERLTEDKYKGSLEQIGKIITRYSDQAGFDLQEFFQVVLFSYLTGNADMHLKNFSLLRGVGGQVALSPAYDLLSTAIALPADREETALTLNGKKSNLNRRDFVQLARVLGLREKVLNDVFEFFSGHIGALHSFLGNGFLPEPLCDQYRDIIIDRRSRLEL